MFSAFRSIVQPSGRILVGAFEPVWWLPDPAAFMRETSVRCVVRARLSGAMPPDAAGRIGKAEARESTAARRREVFMAASVDWRLVVRV